MSLPRNPPPRSKLKAIVDWIDSLRNDGPPLWQSDDPILRDLGVEDMLVREHRLWKQPPELVRDELIRPALEARFGAQLVAELWDVDPTWFDDYTHLVQQNAFNNASARERRPRPQTIESLAVMVVYATYLDCLTSEPGLSKNAYCIRTSVRLGPGIDRLQVGRLVKKVSQRWTSDNERVLFAVFTRIGEQVRLFEKQHPRQVCSKTRLSIQPRNAQRH